MKLENLPLDELAEIEAAPAKRTKFQSDKKKLRNSAKKSRKQRRRKKPDRFIHGVDYYKYMRSPEWDQRRLDAFQRAEWKCEICGKHKRLTGHHLTYKRFGREHSSDILAVCKSCHNAIDGK